MLIRKKYYMLIVVFLCMADSLQAEKESSIKLEKLSPEVIAAMEGNQKTIDSIHTLQAVITRKSTHDYGEKGSRQLFVKEKILYDGKHIRKDILESKFISKETKPLSLGEVEGGGHSYFKPPQIGMVDIDSKESNIDYIPSNDHVFIRPPRWDDSYKLTSNHVLRFQSARGGTLKENILASAKNGFYFTAKNDKVDGEDCVLLTCDYTNPQSTLKIWVVPSKGYCIKKVEDGSKGKIENEYKTTLKKYPPGIWWFDTVTVGKFRRGDAVTSSNISVNSLVFNEPIDPEIFTVWGIDVTPKTKVYDEIRNITYTLAIDEAKDSKKDK